MMALRILVVEDEPIIAMMFAEVLESMGHDVCAIESTEAGAVAAAARCKPNLMIVDARLTDWSGVMAVSRILLSGFVPHVFVSGASACELSLGPDAVMLQKPFDEAGLARAMKQALGAPGNLGNATSP